MRKCGGYFTKKNGLARIYIVTIQFLYLHYFRRSSSRWCSSILLKYCFSTAGTRKLSPLCCWCIRPFSSHCFSISINRRIRRTSSCKPNRNKSTVVLGIILTKIKRARTIITKQKKKQKNRKKNRTFSLYLRRCIVFVVILFVCCLHNRG